MSNDRRRVLNRDSVVRHTITLAAMIAAGIYSYGKLEALADNNKTGVKENKEMIQKFDTRLDGIERTQAGIKSKVDTEALRQQEYRQDTKGTLTRILNKLDRSPR